jgi:hypothetical protein
MIGNRGQLVQVQGTLLCAGGWSGGEAPAEPPSSWSGVGRARLLPSPLLRLGRSLALPAPLAQHPPGACPREELLIPVHSARNIGKTMARWLYGCKS